MAGDPILRHEDSGFRGVRCSPAPRKGGRAGKWRNTMLEPSGLSLVTKPLFCGLFTTV